MLTEVTIGRRSRGWGTIISSGIKKPFLRYLKEGAAVLNLHTGDYRSVVSSLQLQCAVFTDTIFLLSIAFE